MKKLGIFLLLVAAAGCGNTSSNTGNTGNSHPGVTGGSQTIAGDPKAVVAEINGQSITMADVNEEVSSQMTRIQSEVFDTQKQGLNKIIEDRLLSAEAKKRGIEVTELIKLEVTDKVGDISEQELKDFYEQNKARVVGKSFEDVKGPIKQTLTQRKAMVYRKNFMDRLMSEAKVAIFLKRPVIEVSADDDPSKGPKDAPITIIEFTDYQCPFCSRVRPTVSELVGIYGNKVQYVLRDFPLEFHPNATKAAEAATCAGDQDKYWEYSDILWMNQKSLEVPNLKKYAANVSLDQKKFDECLDSGKYTAEVQKDLEAGKKVGVSGTPTFFINGQMISGAQPKEAFQEIIDQALKEKGKS